MNPHTLKRLSQVHPLLRRKVEAVIGQLAAEGLTIEAVSGLRTADEQNALYAQGRTKPGPKVTYARAWQSNHNYGLAVDLCPFVDGKPDWNAPRAAWKRIGEAAERQGLEWGGRWAKFRDMPHVQLPGLSVAQCFALSGGANLQPVWDAASRIAGVVYVIKSPSVDFQGLKGATVYPAPEKSSHEAEKWQKQASGNPSSPGFYPSELAKVPAQAPKQAAESLKTGNTLPVSLVTIQSVCQLFFQQNGFKILLWLTLSILITLVIYEYGPKLKRMVKL